MKLNDLLSLMAKLIFMGVLTALVGMCVPIMGDLIIAPVNLLIVLAFLGSIGIGAVLWWVISRFRRRE